MKMRTPATSAHPSSLNHKRQTRYVRRAKRGAVNESKSVLAAAALDRRLWLWHGWFRRNKARLVLRRRLVGHWLSTKATGTNTADASGMGALDVAGESLDLE